MSTQRRQRSETKQGLHQILMSLYMSYKTMHSEENAKGFVGEIIREEYEYFTGHSIDNQNVSETLHALLDDKRQKMQTSNDYDMQMRYSEDINAIEQVLKILDKE